MRLKRDLQVTYGNGHVARFPARQSVQIICRHRDGMVTIRALVLCDIPGGQGMLWKRYRIPTSYLEPQPSRSKR